MIRTQLYLDEDVHLRLRDLADKQGRTISDLVREAAASRYASGPEPGLVGVLYDSDVIIEILRGRAKTVKVATALEASGGGKSR